MPERYFDKYRSQTKRFGEFDVQTTKGIGAGKVAQVQINELQKKQEARLKTLEFLNEGLHSVMSNLQERKNIREGLKAFGKPVEPDQNFLTGIWDDIKTSLFGTDTSKEYDFEGTAKTATGREALTYSKFKRAGFNDYAENYKNDISTRMFGKTIDEAANQLGNTQQNAKASLDNMISQWPAEPPESAMQIAKMFED